MKRYNILIAYLFIISSVYCQDTTLIFTKATFDGNLYQYFGERLNYPVNSVKDGVEGILRISFHMDANGHIDSIDVLDYPNEQVAQEAAQLLKSTASMWKPTTLNNKSIPYNYQLIIKYEHFSGPPPLNEESAALYDKSCKKFNKEKYDDALELINEAIDINPYYERYYTLRSKIFSSLKDSEKAEADFKKSIYIEQNIIAVIHKIVCSYVTRTTL